MCIGPINTTGDFTFNLKNSNINKLYFKDGNKLATYNNVNNLTLNFENSTIAALHTDYHDDYVTLGVNGKFELNLKDSEITDKCLLKNASEKADATEIINLKGTSSLPSTLEFRNKTAKNSPVQLNYSDGITATIPMLQAERFNINVDAGCTLTLDKEQNNIHSVTNNGTIIAAVNQNWGGNYTGAGGNIVLGSLNKVHINGTVSGNTSVSLQDSAVAADSIIAGISAGSGDSGAMTLKDYTDVTESAVTGNWRYEKNVPNYAQSGYVYLSYHGSDLNDGTSYKNAVFSVKKAYELAIAGNKRIVLCDEYFYDTIDDKGQWAFGSKDADHPSEPILFTNTDGSHMFTEARLIVPTAYNFVGDIRAGYEYDPVNEVKFSTGIRMEGSFKFENIIFACSEGDDYGKDFKYLNIFANGYKTIIGDGCSTDKIRRNIIYGGAYDNAAPVTSTDLTVKSGKFYRIYGGNRTGVVQNGIKLSVVSSNAQSVKGVNLIDGGSTNGTIDVEISGNIQFVYTKLDPPKGTADLTSPVYIKGGKSGAGVNASLKIHDITDRIDYIYGPSLGNATIEIDNVTANTLYMHSCGYNHGNEAVKIGYHGLATVEYIYMGDMRVTSPDEDPKCWASGRYDIYLKEAKVKTISSHPYAPSDSVYPKIDDVFVEGNGDVESEISEVKAVQVNGGGTLTYHGTDLKAENVSNSGTLSLTGYSVKLPNLYSQNGAKLILAEGGNLKIAGAVSGVTTVESERFTITAPTESVEGTDKSAAFTADGIQYSTSGDISTWKKEKEYTGVQAVVYVSGTAGDDDKNDGKTNATAVRTLGKAFDIVNDKGYIVVCGATEFTAWPSIPKNVTITSDDSLINADLIPDVSVRKDYRTDGAKLSFAPGVSDSSYITMLADLTLRNLDIEYSFGTEYGGIDANGHCLTVGEKTKDTYKDNRPADVAFTNVPASNKKFLITGGGKSINDLDYVNLKLYNTSVYGVSAIWGGSSSESSVTVKGNVNLDLQDCSYTEYFPAWEPSVSRLRAVKNFLPSEPLQPQDIVKGLCQ